MKNLNKKGFTLVELLAVIVVLALLMVVAASSIGNAMNNAKKNTLKTEAQKVLSAAYQDVKSQIMLTGSAAALDGLKTITGESGIGYSYYGTEGTDYTYSVYLDTTAKTIVSICVNYKGTMSIHQTISQDISSSSLVPKIGETTNVLDSGENGYCSVATTGVITVTSAT